MMGASVVWLEFVDGKGGGVTSDAIFHLLTPYMFSHESHYIA